MRMSDDERHKTALSVLYVTRYLPRASAK